VGDSPWLGVYRTLLAARLKSQLTYRISFGLDIFGSIMVEATDFAEIYVIFHNVPTLGGLDITSAFLVFGLGTLGFALANAVFGELDTMPTFIRTGTLEVMLLRPLPLLAQIITGDVRLKRLGGAAVGVVVLGVGLATADMWAGHARPALSARCPAAIFGALFPVAGAVQFWLTDAGDVTTASPSVVPTPRAIPAAPCHCRCDCSSPSSSRRRSPLTCRHWRSSASRGHPGCQRGSAGALLSWQSWPGPGLCSWGGKGFGITREQADEHRARRADR
jgi:ABC-2 type transport system permease protein